MATFHTERFLRSYCMILRIDGSMSGQRDTTQLRSRFPAGLSSRGRWFSLTCHLTVSDAAWEVRGTSGALP